MHPSDHDLIHYARLSPSERRVQDGVSGHLAGCEVCREELALIEDWLANVDRADQDAHIRSSFEDTIIRLLRRPSTSFALLPLDMSAPSSQPYLLAADGTTPPAVGLKHRATLYSEDPEVILRVMHDPTTSRDFLQLTAADQSLANHVYIHLADPPMSFLTDEHGVALLPIAALDDPASHAWRLQLPDATFTLKPLEAGKSPDETVIDLPNGDSVAIVFMEEASGISLRVRALSIHGREKIERLRVVVCQSGGRWQVVDTLAPGACVAANLSSDSPIEIRLFVVE